MRLGEIFEKCSRCYSNVQAVIDHIEVINNSRINPVGEFTMIQTFEMNGKINHLILQCNELREIDGFRYLFNELDNILNGGKIEEKIEVVNRLGISLKSVISLLYSMGINHSRIGLDIKMPQTNNITDFRKYIDDLEFIFTKCPFFHNDEERLELESVDIGSIWLVIGVTGVSITAASILLNNIAAFIDKCFIIKSHKLTCEQQKNEIKKEKIDQKQRQDMIKEIENIYQMYVNEVISDLEETTKVKIKDNEERNLVKESLDRLNELMDIGLQIHSAIGSPEEVKAVFAPIEMRYLSIKDSQIK